MTYLRFKVVLYGHVGQIIVYFWDVNPSTPDLWSVELYLSFIFFYCALLGDLLRVCGP